MECWNNGMLNGWINALPAEALAEVGIAGIMDDWMMDEWMEFDKGKNVQQ